MRLRINQIKLNLEEYRACQDKSASGKGDSLIKMDEDTLLGLLGKKISKKIGQKPDNLEVVKESIDARKKPDIFVVYTIDFDLEEKLGRSTLKRNKDVELSPDMSYHSVEQKRNSSFRPVIVGLGPAGMFAALILAQSGLNPVVLERGQDVDRRSESVEKFWNEGVLDTESNVQFGEGGAGTFSDGKLTTGIKDIRIRKVLEEFVKHGGPQEILYQSKPHIGTDILKNVVRGIREDIISLGGEVIFNAKVTGIKENNHQVTGVEYIKDGDTVILDTDTVILAIGHSSRDTLGWLKETGIDMNQKPFSMGVRIEHPQDVIDISQYGKPARELGLKVSDYKINHRCENGRGVYTFCMCPGGKVITASSEEGMVTTNGMSYHDRDSGIANSAVLVDVRTDDFESDDVLAGVKLQQKYERLAYIAGLEQAAEKLGLNKPYSAPNCTWKELKSQIGDSKFVEASLPEFVTESIKEAMPHFGRKIRGFDSDEAKITSVEARSSSPVRFFRNENLTGSKNGVTLKGFYPVGEGAGYAGGITSAAVDGIKSAEKIIKGE